MWAAREDELGIELSLPLFILLNESKWCYTATLTEKEDESGKHKGQETKARHDVYISRQLESKRGKSKREEMRDTKLSSSLTFPGLLPRRVSAFPSFLFALYVRYPFM